MPGGTWLGKPQETTQSSLDTPLSSHWKRRHETLSLELLRPGRHGSVGTLVAFGRPGFVQVKIRSVGCVGFKSLHPFWCSFHSSFHDRVMIFVSYMIAWMICIWYNILFLCTFLMMLSKQNPQTLATLTFKKKGVRKFHKSPCAHPGIR